MLAKLNEEGRERELQVLPDKQRLQDRITTRTVLTKEQYIELRDNIIGPRFELNHLNSVALGVTQPSLVQFTPPPGNLQFAHFKVTRDGTGMKFGSGSQRIRGNGLPVRLILTVILEPVWRQLGIDKSQAEKILRIEEDDRKRRLAFATKLRANRGRGEYIKLAATEYKKNERICAGVHALAESNENPSTQHDN